jgi:outer membrane protein
MNKPKQPYIGTATPRQVEVAVFGWNAPLRRLHPWSVHAMLCLLLVPSLASRTFAQSEKPSSLTLNQAIQFALAHSPELQTATAEIRKQEGNVKSAKSPLLPQVDLLADASRYRFDHGILPGADPRDLHFDNMIYTAGADLHLLVWDFGKTSAQLQATRQRLDSSKLLLDRKREEVIYSVASLFLKAETYDDLIDAAQARKKSLDVLLDQTRQLVKGGHAVPLDLLKVQTRLAQVESDIATLQAGRQGTMSALLAAMGWEGEVPTLTKEEAANAPAALAKQENELLREAFAHRPDLMAAVEESRAADLQVKSAHRSLLPRFDFRASTHDYGANSPVAFGAIIGQILPQLNVPAPSVSHWQADWVVSGRVTFPLFDGGRRRGEMIAAEAQHQQAESAVLRMRLAIIREVRTSQANLASDQQRVKSLEASVAQAQEALRLERVKYQAGRSEINFVLDAEAALLTNDSLLREARRATQIDWLSLDLSLGSIAANSPDVTLLQSKDVGVAGRSSSVYGTPSRSQVEDRPTPAEMAGD